MQSLWTAFNGKKTYIVAAVGIIFAWVSFWNHTMDFNTAMETTMAALGGMAVAHRVTTTSKGN